MESFDQDTIWKHVQTVRVLHLRKYSSNKCSFLVSYNNMTESIISLAKLLNISYISPFKIQNISNDVINFGAKMFLFLNNCPNTDIQRQWVLYYQQVFKKYLYEPTNSGIFLYLMKAKKASSGDGRIIAEKVLERFLTMFDFKFFLPNTAKKILDVDMSLPKSLSIVKGINLLDLVKISYLHMS